MFFVIHNLLSIDHHTRTGILLSMLSLFPTGESKELGVEEGRVT